MKIIRFGSSLQPPLIDRHSRSHGDFEGHCLVLARSMTLPAQAHVCDVT
jgi:hypothetical protein